MIIQHLPKISERGSIVGCLCNDSIGELWTTHVTRVINNLIQENYDQGRSEGYDEGFSQAAGIAS